jgi:hypothetical protein
MTMLLTLSAGSVATLLQADGEDRMTVLDLPAFTIRTLELRGLNLPASMLAGWSLQDLDQLRDRADKAACPCLVLVEDQPLPFADPDARVRAAARDRVHRLAAAAHRLGCNALGIRCDAPDTEEAFDRVCTELKASMPRVERLELNLLLAPGIGLTATPERLTDMIKRVGGFRIGSLPDFGHAAREGNPTEVLRKLAPYAGAVHATIRGFDAKGAHQGYDLAECVRAIRSVGFVNTLAIDYVGKKDPVRNIEQARQVLQLAIDEVGARAGDGEGD